MDNYRTTLGLLYPGRWRFEATPAVNSSTLGGIPVTTNSYQLSGISAAWNFTRRPPTTGPRRWPGPIAVLELEGMW